MLTSEEEKWADVWRDAHETAEAEMPRIESGICKLPGLAALLANFAIKAIEQERERCAYMAEVHTGLWDHATAINIAASIRNPDHVA